ncbi:MAG TPA: hypothetical protein VGB93_14295 [Methylovirgula sp.]
MPRRRERAGGRGFGGRASRTRFDRWTGFTRAGVEPVRPTPDNPDFDMAAREALRSAVKDGLDIVTLARPDRWGLIPVFAFLPPMSAAIPEQSLAVWLLARGDGRFMPEREANICRGVFLDAENAARVARHGLWNDPYYAVIAATDQSVFAEEAATNVIAKAGSLISTCGQSASIFSSALAGLVDSQSRSCNATSGYLTGQVWAFML